MNEGKLKL